MYDTTYRCTYNTAECSEQISVYQKDMLGTLGIRDFDETKINQAVEDLYEKVKDCADLQECMKKGAAIFLTEDMLTGFMVLFSFDYLHITHACISAFLADDNDLFENAIKKLVSKINEL